MEELSKLERMLILMKKYGVTDLKEGGIEIKMIPGYDEPQKSTKSYSDEDLLFYSSNP